MNDSFKEIERLKRQIYFLGGEKLDDLSKVFLDLVTWASFGLSREIKDFEARNENVDVANIYDWVYGLERIVKNARRHDNE